MQQFAAILLLDLEVVAKDFKEFFGKTTTKITTKRSPKSPFVYDMNPWPRKKSHGGDPVPRSNGTIYPGLLSPMEVVLEWKFSESFLKFESSKRQEKVKLQHF